MIYFLKLKEFFNNIIEFIKSIYPNQPEGKNIFNKNNRKICENNDSYKTIQKNIFIQKKNSNQYIKNKKEFLSKKGEFLKSYGEVQIANFLLKEKIEYIYEKPIDIGHRDIYPDFYLPKYDTYIEYWGMLGIKKQYSAHMMLKRNYYIKNNIKLINLYRGNISKNIKWAVQKEAQKVSNQLLKRLTINSYF